MNPADWAGADGPLASYLRDQTTRSLSAYREKPELVLEHANIEITTAEGGYGRKQLYELIQNGADALSGTGTGTAGDSCGRIEVTLTNSCLYVANEGRPVDESGVDALTMSNLSVKKDEQIGRFGLGFKSVIELSDAPEVISRSISMRFDRHAARSRIESVAPVGLSWPMLRLPEPFDSVSSADSDPVLAGLMSWATTVVRLPLTSESIWLSEELESFPGQFLLFCPHVSSLVLDDKRTERTRSISLETEDDGFVRLSDGSRSGRWRILHARYGPSERAISDAGRMARRASVTMMWAVPERNRRDLGRLWAFFPTDSESTLGGVLNAPWKLSPDRRTIIAGTFNHELLTTALPRLVAAGLPSLVDPKDPASILDALPSRGKEYRSWADHVLNQPVFDALDDVPCVPDTTGRLRGRGALRLHPTGLAAGWLDEWTETGPTPSGWVHHSIERGGGERRARAERLLGRDCVASQAEWISALARCGDPVAGSVRALRLIGTILRDEPGRIEACSSAAVLLTADGSFVTPLRGRVFLPTEDLDAPRGTAVVHPDVASASGVPEVLALFGISQVDLVGSLHAMLARHRDERDRSLWERFWRASRRLEPDQVAGIIRGQLAEPLEECLVRTVTGVWRPAGTVLLPGNVIPDDRSRDGDWVVDPAFHDQDQPVFHRIGLTSGPVARKPQAADRWFQDWCDEVIATYQNQLPGGVPRPRPENIRIDRHEIASHLDLLPDLSDEGRARLTAQAQKVTQSRRWQARANDRPTMTMIDPVVWGLRRHGRIPTSVGPARWRQALASGSGLPRTSCRSRTSHQPCAFGWARQ